MGATGADCGSVFCTGAVALSPAASAGCTCFTGAGLGAAGLGAAGFGAAGLDTGGLGDSAFAGSLRGSSSSVPMPCRALSSFRRRSSPRPSAGSASSDTEEAYRRTPCVLAIVAAGTGRVPECIRSAGVGTRKAGREESSHSTACSAVADTDSDTPDSGHGEAPPRARCVAAAIRARGLEATGRTPCSTETAPEPQPFTPLPSDSAGRGTTRPNQPR